MTIKELEHRTGMTRANIRFYEGEGLLTPKRLDNGYRDYSEEDAATLEKIKLLRQLQLDIDTIRKVQQGTLTLEQALFVQTTKLEGDKAVIQRAAEVCRELQQTCIEYAALEPQPWLWKLEATQRPGLPEPPSVPEEAEEKEENVHWACWHPWMRLFARSLDVALYDMIFNAAWLLIFRDYSFMRLQTENLIGRAVWGLLILAFTLAVEPLWLHFWGWTPGKWIFGLKLRNEDGEKLTLAQCWERSWRVFQDGYGWSIPIWGLWKEWQCRKLGLEGRNCWWDEVEDYRYTREERRFSGQMYVAAQAVCMAVMIAVGMWNLLPPCRGDLTVAEFARNYRHYEHVLANGNESALDEAGRWVPEPGPGTGETVRVVFDEGTVYDQPEFTVSDGRVTAVTLHMESSGSIVTGGTRESLALLALSGAADGWNLFNYDLMGWASTADETLKRWEDVELDYRGLHISQQVKFEGYELWGENSLCQLEDTPHSCEKTVTISLME